MGCHFSSISDPWFCSSNAPRPSELASGLSRVGKFGSKNLRHGEVVTRRLSSAMASSCGFCRLN